MGASVAGGAPAMGGSMVMVNPMQPPSPASLGMTSPTGMQYGGMMSPQWQAPPQGAPGGVNTGVPARAPTAPVANKFDPLRADPFAT